jgi:hypothetical protein
MLAMPARTHDIDCVATPAGCWGCHDTGQHQKAAVSTALGGLLMML